MFSSGHRKYRGWVLLQDDEGNFADTRKVTPETVAAGGPLQSNHDDFLLIEVLHHWHWIYRWQMAPRLSRAFREVTYRLARGRLRALLTTPWGDSGYTVGDVFTSEKAVAILERIHVFSPRTLFGELTDKEVEWDGQTVANINFNKIEPAFDEAEEDRRRRPDGLGRRRGGGTRRQARGAEPQGRHRRRRPVADPDTVPGPPPRPVAAADRQGGGAGHRRDRAARRGAGHGARVRFTVTDRETEPGRLHVSRELGHEQRLAGERRARRRDEYELVLEAPAGAGGEVHVTITAATAARRPLARSWST